ncbi:cytochrome P450 [Mycena galopus ATCC 62051]|nr:cytochrome P450 [Mycena galopus ATCC 62051]
MSSPPFTFSVPAFVFVATCTYILYRVFKPAAPSLSNIVGPPAENYFLGNIRQLISEDAFDFHEDLAQNYGGVVKLHGSCGNKQLYIHDNAAMHSVLVTNEAIFPMPEAFLAANWIMFGPCLVSTTGARHRRARKIMNPVFSTARLREIFPIMSTITHKASSFSSATLSGHSAQEIDMHQTLSTASLEFIGQCGLGHSFAASKTEAAMLDGMQQLLFAARNLMIPMQLLPPLLRTTPASFRRWMINYIPLRDLWLARDLVNAMEDNSKIILAKKKSTISGDDVTLLEQIGQGKDIMSLLMRASAKATPGNRLSEQEFLGQMNLIMFAATDTTSTSTSRALQELARHPEIQLRLRDEVTNAVVHGDMDYDALCNLPFLEAVCRETLRLHAPVIATARQARADVVLPLSEPMIGVNGSPITEIFVPSGTFVHIGMRAANTRRTIWGPDANEWKPERWLAPLPQTVVDAQIPGVYSKLMTFIGGPRGCIGFKFAEMSMKVILSVLIKNFVFATSEQKIVWKFGQVEGPTVNGKQAMPMMVSPVQSRDLARNE